MMLDLTIDWILPLWFTAFILGFYLTLEEQQEP